MLRTARVVFSIISLTLFLSNCGDDSNPQCVLHEDCQQGYLCKESECVPVELNTESHSPGTVSTSSSDVTAGSSGADSSTQPPPVTVECTPSIETCNGFDDDCDGEADEDGVCDPKECYPGEQTDCNTLRPGICEDGTAVCLDDYEFGFCLSDAEPSLELCGDGLDNDCDGEADEFCECPVVGITAACDTGKPGICSAGSMYCRNTHQWGECTQIHFESPEVCGDGLDNDCDGEADEECYCTAGETLACVTGLYGVCSQGLMTCSSNNTFGDCLPVTNMTAEVCGDRMDNDCDGQIDNNCACTSGTQTSCITDLPGVCSAGVASCLPDGTGYGFCVASVSPISEVCGDGLDNDCDGSVDNGCFCEPGSFSPCVTPMLGACAWGIAECAADGMGYGFCMPTTVPIPELCNDGIDNDCDGVVDNGCACVAGTTMTCETGLPGLCGIGLRTCLDDGSGFGPCEVLYGPGDVAEICDNGIDEDCNGLVDDGCACVAGTTAWCNTGQLGECSNGLMTCLDSEDGYGSCEVTYTPEAETCFNGLDDDCDGVVDNGCACVAGTTMTCETGLHGLCGVGLRTCLDDGSGYGPCQVLFGPGDVAEICDNGIDEDCNGLVDDGCACVAGTTAWCNTGQLGECSNGLMTCLDSEDGYGLCEVTYTPEAETCFNGLDDDCDGVVDNGCACVAGTTMTCETGLHGLCGVGLRTCLDDGSGYGPCQVLFGPGDVAEICDNGIDEDCNGLVDDGCACVAGTTAWCNTGQLGECSNGLMTCLDSEDGYGSCEVTYTPEAETCFNGLDDDCDGVVDNGCACVAGTTMTCETGLPGLCGVGLRTCLDDGSGFGPCEVLLGPGDVAEICDNGIDEDCNGLVDDGCACVAGTTAWCNTGQLGECSNGLMTCLDSEDGYGLCEVTYTPEAETCFNGLDDDCDGVVDNGCACVAGTTMTCETGLPGLCGVGLRTCLDDGSGFGPCEVLLGPGDVAEICDNGIDEDCNGLVDDGCACVAGTTAWCNTGQLGECSNGLMTCLDSEDGYGSCEVTYTPEAETCFNGLDDDCDGVVDNGCACVAGTTMTCETGLPGLCGVGLRTCLDDGSGFGPCEVLLGPGDVAEICDNGIDEDCNGLVDDGCACVAGTTAWCNTGQLGECSNGLMTCLDSEDGYGLCEVTYTPEAETCFNGLDDDCDGVVDNGCACVAGTTMTCETGLPGLCGVGLRTCLDDGSGFGPCEVLLGPGDVAEICDNGIDEDCNGLVDDGCSCVAGTTAWCNTGQLGECSNGLMTCLDSEDGYGSCEVTYTPEAETCFNGLDDDCDGVVDNGCACVAGTTMTCETGLPGLCGVGLRTCLDDGSGFGPCEVLLGPGDVAEICDNGIDEDCNGLVDDGCACVAGTTAWCNTGQLGECSNGLMTCLDSEDGYGSCEVTYTPEAETCFNGLDDDCDGVVDNGCACVAGTTMTCETGLPGLCGVGLRTCLDDGSGFGPCEVLLGPGDVAEICDNGIDEDCNGLVDDGCACVAGTTAWCNTGQLGECSNGLMTCLDSEDGYGLCEVTYTPEAETCFNGLDDDCDGVVDNGCACVAGTTMTCETGLPGLCGVGLRTCLDDGSGFGPCEVLLGPGDVAEICDNGIDEDCNGLVDDGCACVAGTTAWCNTGQLGECSNGLMTCLDSEDGYGSCEVTYTPEAETCFNGLDDDCDGVVDNGCACVAGTTMTCETGLPGLCGVGLRTCLDDGSGFGPCEVLLGPGDVAEICDNGIDEDCNGLVDDGCACVAGTTAWCNTGQLGECSNGLMTCLDSEDGYGLCEVTYTPEAETCFNGLDDDCDGVVDNGCACVAGTTMTCETGLPGLCGVGLRTCLDDGSGYGPCQVLFGPGDVAEICDNGIDEDCNGLVDDGCACVAGTTAWCNTGQLGECSNGLMTCLDSEDGYGLCEVTYTPEAETCFNGLDDDCDGVVDNGCACVAGTTMTCETGLPGLCGVGLRTCLDDGSGYGPCQVLFGPGDVAEICDNGIDEDCNGLVDDGCACVAGTTAWCNTGQLGECSNGLMTCLDSEDGYGLCEVTYTPEAETCFNGLDDDCDGVVDNGCACVAGTTMTCETGLPGLCGVGLRTCLDDGSGFGPCEVLLGPGDVAEICDNGIDEDCNGLVDDGCACVAGTTAWCNTGQLGECSNGLMTCLDSEDGYGLCEVTYTPEAETCFNGLDDDCDGVVDNGCACVAGTTMTCETGLPGLCGVGLRTCLDDGSGFGPCEVLLGPGDVAEICDNGIDEDCNGLVDDGCACVAGTVISCNTGLWGVCSVGQRTCDATGTAWGPCEVVILPGDNSESCLDGLDNDCDGAVNEGCVCDPTDPTDFLVCDTGLAGICAVGQADCIEPGDFYGACQILIGPGDVAEVCGDGIDQNCNGLIDEGCNCVPGATIPCNTGLPGICANGQSTCLPSGDTWGFCEVLIGVGDLAEICGDLLDNNCNGIVDGVQEGCPPF